MDLGIKARTAMVAAASQGLGRAVAEALLKEGARVSICSRNADHLEKTRTELQRQFPHGEIVATPCDVSLARDLTSWYEITRKQLGPVDILVTNTGGPPVGEFMDVTEENWDRGIDSTLKNVIRLSRLVLPEMKERRWGRIVHLTSLAAKEPIDILTISSTLRAGLSALTRNLSNQFAQYGICINAVLPGHIMTDRQIELNRLKAESLGVSFEEVVRAGEARIPARRFGKPEEIGNAVAFLCSEKASYISGASIQVDGGLIHSTF